MRASFSFAAIPNLIKPAFTTAREAASISPNGAPALQAAIPAS